MTQRKRPSARRTLSCLPCRQHKLRCDRGMPCQSCIRYRREDQCRRNPAPSTFLRVECPAPQTGLLPPVIAPAPTTPLADGSTVASPQGQSETEQSRSSSDSSGTLAAMQVARVRESWQQQPFSPFHGPVLLPTDAVGGSAFPAPQVAHDPNQLKLFWKLQLTAILPSQNQCDLLLSYFYENVNWIYQTVHVPSFRRVYASLWTGTVDEVDLIWLSLLFTMISTSALLFPSEAVEIVGYDVPTIRNLAHVWHSASRQALHSGQFESKPGLTQLQTFLTTQTYWLATKNIEAMNSALGQAVRNAQALGLDKDLPGANCLDTELRRRAWWELWCCDTFQSLCLDRMPLIHTPASKVPLPLNCNDIDITETSAVARSMEEPTDMSASIGRAQAFQIFRKLFVNDGEYLSCYEYVRSIDQEVQQLEESFPWYFRSNEDDMKRPRSEYMAYNHCVLHIAIYMQRIRMNRPFLHARIGESWAVCAKAAQKLLAVYRNIRELGVEKVRRSSKFFNQSYQIYTAAVTLAAFLLVERSFPDFPSDVMRRDIEMAISDLESRDTGMSLISEGTKILRKMLKMCDDQRVGNSAQDQQQARESLVNEIASIFGGEQPTRKYLKRCDIAYVLNVNVPEQPISAESPVQEDTGHDATLSSNHDEWWLSPNLDLALELLDSEQWDLWQPDFMFNIDP